MSKLILSVNQDELDLFKKQFIHLPDIQEEIDKMFENVPDKRKKEYKKWKEDINFLIDLYNTKSKYKTYNRVK